MNPLTPPFSSRNQGRYKKIENDFPKTARTGLIHLLSNLIDQSFISDWTKVARELERISREIPTEYNSNNVESLRKAKQDSIEMLLKLSWDKTYDFCERLYSYLPENIVYVYDGSNTYTNEPHEIYRDSIQSHISTELQNLFLEEYLAYEFSNGVVRRRGRKHTVDLATKAQVVMGDPQLLSARKHYEKALQFFRHPTNPDYENTVKEAVCAVEAAGKVLFSSSKASTLGELARWFKSTNDIAVPPALIQTITGVYGFRNDGKEVAHGGAKGGTATQGVAEYILAVCASQIIYFVDLQNVQEPDIPF